MAVLAGCSQLQKPTVRTSERSNAVLWPWPPAPHAGLAVQSAPQASCVPESSEGRSKFETVGMICAAPQKDLLSTAVDVYSVQALCVWP